MKYDAEEFRKLARDLIAKASLWMHDFRLNDALLVAVDEAEQLRAELALHAKADEAQMGYIRANYGRDAKDQAKLEYVRVLNEEKP